MAVRFLPWIPRSPFPRLGGVRLLLLGESHYEEDHEDWHFHDADARPDLTRKIIAEWGLHPASRRPFFANLFTMMTGQPWSAAAAELAPFWNSVFFYNYVQTLVPEGARHAPTKTMFASGGPAFREVLEQIRPEAVIVLGRRLWRNMLDQDEWIVERDQGLGSICGYRLADRTLVPTAHFPHPSSEGFSPSEWHPKVAAFLDWVTKQQ